MTQTWQRPITELTGQPSGEEIRGALVWLMAWELGEFNDDALDWSEQAQLVLGGRVYSLVCATVHRWRTDRTAIWLTRGLTGPRDGQLMWDMATSTMMRYRTDDKRWDPVPGQRTQVR